MCIAASLQPDQDASLWSGHTALYERVFEPLTTAFAKQVFERLGDLSGLKLVDVAAGTGGAALEAASRRAAVMATDAAPGMVRRISNREPRVTARVMDGNTLDLGDADFDIGFSCFGIVLFVDPAGGMAELFRVVRPGGRVAIVTWTEPERFSLAARLQQAIVMVRGQAPAPGPLPAQLRFADPSRLRELAEGAGLAHVQIMRMEADMVAASAAELAASLEFAPGLTAMLNSLGPDREKVLKAFVDQLQVDQGLGPVRLGAVAHAAIADRP